ncbi:hypothetical protein [Xanthobacter sp. VNH20]|uniref:hypothetical protein n=1 Tax=Xanthobacteraceae TaxID=335928 RepID=UPI0032B44300
MQEGPDHLWGKPDPALLGWLSWSSARPSTINPQGVGYAEHAADYGFACAVIAAG